MGYLPVGIRAKVQVFPVKCSVDVFADDGPPGDAHHLALGVVEGSDAVDLSVSQPCFRCGPEPWEVREFEALVDAGDVCGSPHDFGVRFVGFCGGFRQKGRRCDPVLHRDDRPHGVSDGRFHAFEDVFGVVVGCEVDREFVDRSRSGSGEHGVDRTCDRMVGRDVQLRALGADDKVRDRLPCLSRVLAFSESAPFCGWVDRDQDGAWVVGVGRGDRDGAPVQGWVGRLFARGEEAVAVEVAEDDTNPTRGLASATSATEAPPGPPSRNKHSGIAGIGASSA